MTTSLELSKKLVEAGLKIETLFTWAGNELRYNIKVYGGEGYYYPAYSTDELLAVMPCEIMINTETYRGISELTIAKHIDNLFSVGYGKHYSCPYQEDKSLPEALGKMILWLLSRTKRIEKGL